MYGIARAHTVDSALPALILVDKFCNRCLSRFGTDPITVAYLIYGGVLEGDTSEESRFSRLCFGVIAIINDTILTFSKLTVY